MMLTGVFTLAVLIAKLFPETPIGRALHSCLVEEPSRLAARVERKHLIYLALLLLAGQAMAAVVSFDLALLAAWDISIYLDLTLAVWTIAAVARGKVTWSLFKAQTSRMASLRPAKKRPAVRTRTPRIRVKRMPANDDDDEGEELPRAA
jgi:hypothetical protein